MTNDKKKIVFISHESSLTGAPVLLLNLLKLLRRLDSFRLNIILYRGGQLEKDFREIAPTYTLKSGIYHKQKKSIPRLLNYIIYRVRRTICLNRIKDADLIIVNTVAIGDVMQDLKRMNIPLVTYIHELQSVIDVYNSKGLASLAIISSDYFIVPARVVADNLINKYRVDQKKIFYLNSYVPAPAPSGLSKTESQHVFLSKHAIPGGKYYVAGMGAATCRKGIDIFIDTCLEVSQYEKNIYFVWIGGFEDEETRKACMDKIESHSIGNSIKIIGKVPYSPYTLLPFELFLLTSREDPYPLVVIEAAYMQLPTICFGNSGGATQFISPDCGWIVADLSPSDLAAKIIEARNDPEETRERGSNAYKKAVEWHSDERLITSQFQNLVEMVLR